MPVNSLSFAAFFAVVFFAYYLPARERVQNIVLLFASWCFYAIADLKMLPLIVGTTMAFYVLGLVQKKCADTGRERALFCLTLTGVALGVGLLGYFKYLNFFIEQFSSLLDTFGLHTNIHTFSIILPLGISFFTFRLISYSLEIYFGRIEACRDFITFASYVAFFPCLLAGPIDRPQNFLPQLRERRVFNYAQATDGLKQILWGMFKKMVVADNLAKCVDSVWADCGSYNGSALAVVAVFYAVQLYADFSGYSDMAIGVGKLLGFRIARNFNCPYFAQNIADYWRRWHMSLTSWVTDYVFTPLTLAFSKWGKSGIVLAVFVNFFILGLWHGANWTFIVFGIWHALLFALLVYCGNATKSPPIETFDSLGIFPKPATLFRMALTFISVLPATLIFRAPSMGDFCVYAERMLCSGTLFSTPGSIGVGHSAPIFAATMFIAEWLTRTHEVPLSALPFRSRVFRWCVYLLLTVIVVEFDGGSETFVYQNF